VTTTTPESRASLAYTAFLVGQYGMPVPLDKPTFQQLTPEERKGWIKSSQTIWDLAKTGRATI